MASPVQSPFDPRDPAGCRAFLANLPITDVPLAHDLVGKLLKAVHDTPPPATEYLAVLEAAHEPLAFLQEEVAVRYASRPLPANEVESAIFAKVVSLWRLMAGAYARVADLGSNHPGIQEQLALICQRCLHYAGQTIVEHYRAHRQLDAGFWLELHGFFDSAEEWGLADTEVCEAPGKAGTTGTIAYATVLLIDLANPYGRTPKELAWIVRWAKLMAPRVAIRKPDDAGGRGYGLDLMQDHGLLPVDHLSDTPSARLFDTSKLGAPMQQLLARLKAGEDPKALGLGDDCSAVHALRLLLQLYRPWCLAAMPRRFERSRGSGTLSIALPAESIYFHVTGVEFVQPQHARIYSRAEMERYWTFRNQLDPKLPLNLRTAALGFALDVWHIADQSLNGYRVSRDVAGPRVEHNQLIALKPPGKDNFLLGRITWLFQERGGGLQAGIHVLPGPVTGVAIRPTGVGVGPSDKYVPGFFMPGVVALKEPLSVILPPGWFSPGRVVEIYTDRPVAAKLQELIAKGPNFERCSFALADQPLPAAL
jgi:hypothetical protein